MIRVCKDGKKKYKSLGVSVNPKFWNFEKNTLKPNSPNYEYLSRIIADKASELSEEIVKLKSERKYFTASTLLEENSQRVKPRTVNDLFCEQINPRFSIFCTKKSVSQPWALRDGRDDAWSA